MLDDLVAANRILADQEIVDAYGHVSARHERIADRYLMAHSVPPELVSTEDVFEHTLDSAPVEPAPGTLYSERFIHGEIYKARPDVGAIVHGHSPFLILFGVTGVPLRPLWHMSAFIGDGLPIFEIRDATDGGELLVDTPELGRALAAALGPRPAVLMRGHGVVVVAPDLPTAVGRSIYLELNAKLQAQAMASGAEITSLSAAEVSLRQDASYARAWQLWKRRALRTTL